MESKRTYKLSLLLIVAFVVIMIAACAISVMFSSRALSDQGAASIRRSVLQTAMQCNAIEGAYPSSLSYLEQHYGLSINHEDYDVFYEAFAGNVAPTVTVVPK